MSNTHKIYRNVLNVINAGKNHEFGSVIYS